MPRTKKKLGPFQTKEEARQAAQDAKDFDNAINVQIVLNPDDTYSVIYTLP